MSDHAPALRDCNSVRDYGSSVTVRRRKKRRVIAGRTLEGNVSFTRPPLSAVEVGV